LTARGDAALRATIVIPSYWGRASGEALNPGDAVYDHPTPLDEPGTLERALESIKVLKNRHFNVVVISAATHSELSSEAEEKVRGIVAPFEDRFPVVCVSHSFEAELRERIKETSFSDVENLVSLTGYSNIRNMCLIVTELARSEVAVLFDDDEVYEDPDYIDKVFENMGKEHEGKPVRAIAGYYVRPEGGYLLPPPDDWWMTEWPMVEAMNEAFKIIDHEPRLKPTPFVFGGNMCIHRDVFHRVAFDPNVRRGEDIDYLMNCKFFGIDFLLDRELSIRHLPPKTQVPAWKHFRENIYRFLYARQKLRQQHPVDGLRHVDVEELDPYPGRCMRDDLEDLIFRTSVLTGLHYKDIGDGVGFKESMRNIYLARYDASPDFDTFMLYLEYQRRWEELMKYLTKDEMFSRKLLGGT
jgi:glycosyltransferase involved in cell wall biosynthesis